MKIINVGVYPPPYGGVSNHLKRLHEYLRCNGEHDVVIDISGIAEDKKEAILRKSWKQAILYLIFCKQSVVHFHNFSVKNSLVYVLLGIRHKTILSFHNERFLIEINRHNLCLKNIVIFCLNQLDFIVVDNRHCKELANSIINDRHKIVNIPEFIPPVQIPPLGNSVIYNVRKNHDYLIASNAFKLSFHKGQDLYGIDLLIEMMQLLITKEELNVALVFLLPCIGDTHYFQLLRKRIAANNLEKVFIFITDPLDEASSLWQESDLVIRATNTDGNSLTILEALSVGTPVVASDCVERPYGVIKFRNRDVADLVKKVKQVLINIDNENARVKNIKPENNARTVLNLYKKVMQHEIE